MVGVLVYDDMEGILGEDQRGEDATHKHKQRPCGVA